MEWYEAIILGLVQGLTEFLPVSSSGHLLIGEKLLGVSAGEEDLTFELMVHAATVLSTIVVFRKLIWDLLKGFFGGIRTLRIKNRVLVCNDQTDYLLKMVVSMIPVLVVGLSFEDDIEAMFGNSLMPVGFSLLATAALLFFSDFASRPKMKSIFPANNYRNGISYWQAFVVGIGQAFALLPGLSRSGTTISTGLICGVKRESMAQFSFLMVLVPILGANFLKLLDGDFTASATDLLPLILGFISAFVSGLFACKVMIALVKKARLSWFALYCLLAALVIFIFG